MTAPAVSSSRLHDLTGGEHDAMMLLGLTTADISDGQSPADLDLLLARHANRLPQPMRVDVYLDLREAVERAIDREWDDLPLGWTDEQIDGEVLWSLFRLTRGVSPCRACFDTAYLLSMMRPAGDCPKHAQAVA